MNDRKAKRSRRLRNNGFIEVGNAFITLILIGIVIVGGAIIWTSYTFYSSGPSTGEQTFLVERGAGLDTVAARLENQGLIGDRTLFGKCLRIDERRRGVQRHVEKGRRSACRTRAGAGRDAFPVGAARVIEMHVRINRAGQHEQAGGINFLASRPFGQRGDFSLGDADRRMRLRVADEQVEIRHVVGRD